MFIYAGGRQTGKTGKIIEWFLADPMNRVIITPNVAQANHIIKRIRATMGVGYPFLDHIYPYHESKLHGNTRGSEIGVENVDMLLAQLLGKTVAFATVSGVKFDAPEPHKPWWRFW